MQPVDRHAKFVQVFEELTPEKGIQPIDAFRSLVRRFPRADAGAFFFQRGIQDGQTHKIVETILALDPFETIRIRKGVAEIENAGGTLKRSGSPFEIISQRVQDYRAITSPELPFFQGGALGYFSYDSVRFVEPTLTGLDKGEGFDAEFMLFRKLVIFDHVREKIIVMSGYFPQTQGEEEGTAQARAEIQELIQAYRASAPAKTRREPGAGEVQELATREMRSMLGKDGYLKGVKKLKGHIRAGDIFQAVLSDKLSAPFSGNPLELFEILSLLSPAPYRFYFSTGKRAFLGASPEMLVKVSGSEIETHPIAGTRPRGATEAEERKLETQLLRSEKEKAEHLMLVDLARNDIGRVSKPGTVRVAAYMELKKFSGVMHLVSRVTGQLLPGVTAVEALASCFPAGTLSGAPKIRAMQLLSELETASRGFYGGAVVAASFAGNLDSCIAIRSVQVQDGRATIQVGAGIVADSQPEREYAEVQHKSRMARRALALASRGEA